MLSWANRPEVRPFLGEDATIRIAAINFAQIIDDGIRLRFESFDDLEYFARLHLIDRRYTFEGEAGEWIFATINHSLASPSERLDSVEQFLTRAARDVVFI
jgi:hypothetical protein